MTRKEEVEFNKKSDRMVRGHRDVPNGRNFVFWNCDRKDLPKALRGYRKGYDCIKWESTPPGQGLC